MMTLEGDDDRQEKGLRNNRNCAIGTRRQMRLDDLAADRTPVSELFVDDFYS
jgi:hypothetical protein